MKIIRPNEIKIENKLECKQSSPIEAISQLIRVDKKHIQHVTCEQDGNVIECEMHPFVEASHRAFASHLPLVITPDIIWYCISSAIATHINKQSEELRNKFVDHEGKKRIEIRRDDFVFGSQNNPWNEVVDDFCAEMKELTKTDIVEKLEANYSTTTKVARVASQIVIMDAMQKYFEYYVSTRCGIPEIRVMGEKDDWVRIKTRANELIDMFPDLQNWSIGLNEILDNFIKIFDENNIDNDFWNKLYKFHGGSGGPYVTGWIIGLFPYLNEGKLNRFCWDGKTWKDDGGHFGGLKTSQFFYHMNKVPFIWDYLGTKIDMLFCGGLVGVNVGKDFALTPVFGYAITEDKINKQKQKEEYE